MTDGDWRDGGFQAASALRGDSRLGCGVDGSGQSHRWLSPIDRWRLLRRESADSKLPCRHSQVAGRRPVDVPGMTSRVEVAIETALRRLG